VDLDLLTSSYDYDLPKSQIALEPAKPADSAKLLVYRRDNNTVTHTRFKEILNYLPEKLAIFLNDTRVIKARLFGKKESGGAIELLLNRPLKSNLFEVLVKGRVREGITLTFDGNLKAKIFKIKGDGSREVKFYRDGKELNFQTLISILDRVGHTPLPPYIEREDREDDAISYQTIFAKKSGAVAAPTASLHFTPELFERMRSRYEIYTLTLHVGIGTFKGVKSESITSFNMHSEYFEIPSDSAKLLDSKRKILAVGTTVTRTVEHYVRTKKFKGECNLFLHPKNPPNRVNYLLTNFHLPKSTLIMLVSSFIGREVTLDLYQEAIKKNYRFFSYGDAMLII
jgi:S-adenosylmethionine:tRNA ribosyltransferase-isomerase